MIRAGSKNISIADLVRLVEAYGFGLDRQKGNHRVYCRPGVRDLVNLQPRNGVQAKVWQIRQLVALVARLGWSLDEGEEPQP